jgi:hypothetical protein
MTHLALSRRILAVEILEAIEDGVRTISGLAYRMPQHTVNDIRVATQYLRQAKYIKSIGPSGGQRQAVYALLIPLAEGRERLTPQTRQEPSTDALEACLGVPASVRATLAIQGRPRVVLGAADGKDGARG